MASGFGINGGQGRSVLSQLESFVMWALHVTDFWSIAVSMSRSLTRPPAGSTASGVQPLEQAVGRN